jgi:Protein of unknown function, DUF481
MNLTVFMKKYFSLCFCWAMLCAAFPAASQIINIESARMQSDTVGWMGGGSAGLALRQSTQKVFGFDAEAHLQYKTKKDKGLWLILGNVGFLKGGGQKYFSNRFAHLRYNYKVNDWLRWEAFSQVLNNQITQIHTRFLVGTGPRFKLVKNNILRLYAASLVMYEREKEITDPVVRHNDIRNSSYISFTYTPKANSNVELISTTFYQPLFRKFSDYRILNQVTFKVKASKHFALSVKWDYLYDRFPAGNAPRTTYNLLTGIDVDL